MIDLKTNATGNIGEVIIRGDMIVQNVSELKKYLLDVFKNYDHLKINIENVDNIDLSHLQLLCSAHKYAIKQKKHFELGKKIQGSYKKAIDVSGISFHLGCELDKNVNCLFEQMEER
jgi:anti-anti-sigma regulatory factor